MSPFGASPVLCRLISWRHLCNQDFLPGLTWTFHILVKGWLHVACLAARSDCKKQLKCLAFLQWQEDMMIWRCSGDQNGASASSQDCLKYFRWDHQKCSWLVQSSYLAMEGSIFPNSDVLLWGWEQENTTKCCCLSIVAVIWWVFFFFKWRDGFKMF